VNGGEPSSGPLSSALVMRWRLPIACVTAALTQLTFIDAAGLRALVQARMLVHGRGGQLTLHGARPLLRRMLEITELDTAFDLESDLTTPV